VKTILLVIGTRPEAVKMCPLVAELKKRPDRVRALVCVTGQHRGLLDPILRAFSVVPDYSLGAGQPGQSLAALTSAVLGGFDGVLAEARPDLVLVHGDTTSAFAAALAAFYRRIPVGHVEAGMRTYDIGAPFPEELNRLAVDGMSRLFFAPTEHCRAALLREGRPADAIFVTGNTVIDALKTTVRADFTHPALEGLGGRRLILLTAHRRENLGPPMERVFRAVRRVTEAFPDVLVLYPVHPNPAVRKAAEAAFGGCEGVHLTEPLDVIDFHNILARAHLVLTDSGGLQEEAPALRKPVIVLRDVTERPEGVAAGGLLLAGTDENAVFDACRTLLTDAEAYDRMARAENPYGDGTAAKKIAELVLREDMAY